MKLLFTLLSIGVLSVLAAQKISAEGNSEVTRLTLVYLDSTEKHFSLPDKPEITFEDARIHILSGTVDTYVDRSELSHFHFTKSGSTVSAIDDVWACKDFSFPFDGNIVEIRGPEFNGFKVLDVKGQIQMIVDAVDGVATANLCGLSSGVYIVVVPGEASIKVLKN